MADQDNKNSSASPPSDWRAQVAAVLKTSGEAAAKAAKWLQSVGYHSAPSQPQKSPTVEVPIPPLPESQPQQSAPSIPNTAPASEADIPPVPPLSATLPLPGHL